MARARQGDGVMKSKVPPEQTKRGNLLLRSKNADQLIQAMQLVADKHVTMHQRDRRITNWNAVLYAHLQTSVHQLQRAGLVANPAGWSGPSIELWLTDAGKAALDGAKLARAADPKRHKLNRDK